MIKDFVICIKISIFSNKNYFSSYHGSFVINKNVNIEKRKKNEFCMSNDYGSKIDLIALKFLEEVDFG